jgi:inositol-phosphate phosphatase/L-galactose 1-phosphate phosphatase/histidinol-phosphatase
MKKVPSDFLSESQSIEPPEEFIHFAQTLADAARPIAHKYFRTPLLVDHKADASPVTVADRTIEATLRDLIAARYPNHSIMGEEMGGDTSSEFSWVIDPIDGTKSFICGMPLFGTLIALLHHGTPTLGIIDMPILNERWIGTNRNATLQGRKISTSGLTELSNARLFSTSPDMFADSDREAFERLSAAVGLRRFGGDCYIYGLLAAGHCDLVVEANLHTYDIMALIPVVEGAGGVMRTWSGDLLSANFEGRVVAAATPELLEQALTWLKYW